MYLVYETCTYQPCENAKYIHLIFVTSSKYHKMTQNISLKAFLHKHEKHHDNENIIFYHPWIVCFASGLHTCFYISSFMSHYISIYSKLFSHDVYCVLFDHYIHIKALFEEQSVGNGDANRR